MAAIQHIGEKVKALLAQGHSSTVELLDPVATRQKQANGVSLWLYQVQVDEFTRNNARPATNAVAAAANGRRRQVSAVPPLGLTLCFLVTPLTDNPANDFDVLERMLLTIHEAPILRVQVPAEGIDEHVRLVLPRETLEERLRLWESLKTPAYRMSFVLQARIARLFATTTIDESPVLSLSAVGSSERDGSRA